MIRTVLYEEDHHHWKFIELILKLLWFIFTHNWFSFKGSHYLQRQGVAMGTCCATAYANLHLGGWERNLFANNLLSNFTNHILCWMHYIDNVFIVWTDTRDSLDEFIKLLNQNNFNLKITYNCDRQKTSFLDLTIFKDKDNY